MAVSIERAIHNAALFVAIGEYQEKPLVHPGKAEEFYRGLASVAQAIRVGMEAGGDRRGLSGCWKG